MDFNFFGQNFSTEKLFERAHVPVEQETEKQFVALVQELDQVVRPMASEEGATTPPICSHRPNRGLLKNTDPVVKLLRALGELSGWKPKFFAGDDFYNIKLTNGI